MKIVEKIKSATNLKSIAILSAGSLGAQALNFIGSIVIAKQYSGPSIGEFTYFLSIVAMFSTIINGRYDVQIVSAKDDEEVDALIKLSTIIMIAFSLLVSCGCFVLAITGNMKNVDGKVQILYVFPLLIVAGLINILNAYNNRYSEYKLISSAYLSRTIFQNLCFFITGLIMPSASSLLFGQLVGQFAGVKKQSARLKHRIKEIARVPRERLVGAAQHYRDQLTFSVPATFINAISYSIISLLVGNVYGMAILALYSYSVRVLGLPLAIFSSNIAKVHFKNATDEVETSNSFVKCTKKVILFSTLLAIMMVIFLVLFAPGLFELIYGSNWRMAGVYVQILSPMFALRMIVGSIGFTFIIANKQRIELFFQIALLVAFVLLAVIVYINKLSIIHFIIILSVAYSIIYFVEIITMLYISGRTIKK